MDDVGHQIMLAGGNEDLGAGDGIGAIGLRFGAGLEQAEVGAAMWLGQAHGAGPLAGHQRLQKYVLLPSFAIGFQRLHRAMTEHREIAPRQIGRIHQFGQHPAQQRGHALAAMFRGIGQAGPATLDKRIEGLLESGRRGDIAGGLVEVATDLIANFVEWCQHRFGEARRFLQHRISQFTVDVGKAELGAMRLCTEYIKQGKAQIVEGGFVSAHDGCPCRCRPTTGLQGFSAYCCVC